MKSIYLPCFKLVLLGFFCIFSPIAMAANTKGVEDAYYSWCDAIGKAKGHADTVVKFYAEGATLFPTLSSNMLVNTHGGLNDYFTKLTSINHIQCEPEKLVTTIYENTAVNIGFYRFTFIQHHQRQTLPARFTFVYEKFGNKWLITHHHSSKLPSEI